MNEFFSVFKEFLPLITTGGAIISAAGLIPRIGPGRAIWLALRSRYAFKPYPESLRLAEIKVLRRVIAEKNFGQSYVVVTGEKGVGKTCLLNSVTSKTAGVIKLEAQPRHSEDTIIKNTLQQLTKLPFDFIPPFESAKRVIFWYRLFTFGRSPIVVINATERKVGQDYAGLTGAVRTLVDRYKLRVIVDSSPNSLDETLLRTKRQIVFEIQPMTKEMIWQIGQLQDLFQNVKDAGLEETVFAVLGGNPADYEELWNKSKIGLQAGGDAREVIGSHLCGAISSAINLVRNAKSESIHMKEIIKLFDAGKMFILCDTLVEKNLKRLTPDKVFREVKQSGVFVLIPASNAIGIVLRHNLTEEPSLTELEEQVKNKA